MILGSPVTPSLIASLDIDQMRNAVWNGGCRHVGDFSPRTSGSMTARGCLETSTFMQPRSPRPIKANEKTPWESAVLLARMHLRELESPRDSDEGSAEHVAKLEHLLRRSAQSLQRLLDSGRCMEAGNASHRALELSAASALSREAALKSQVDKARAAQAAAEHAAAALAAELAEARRRPEPHGAAPAAQAERLRRERAPLRSELQRLELLQLQQLQQLEAERGRAASLEAALLRSESPATRLGTPPSCILHPPPPPGPASPAGRTRRARHNASPRAAVAGEPRRD